MVRVKFFSTILILVVCFSITCSNENRQINKISNSNNLLSCISDSKDIQNIIVSYLANKWKKVEPLCFHAGVSKLVFSSDGKHLASHCMHGLIKIWDISTKKCIKEIYDGIDDKTGRGNIFSISSFSDDGKYIASGLYRGAIKIWELESGNCIKDFTAHKEYVKDLLYFKDGKSIISCSNDKTLKVLDLSSGQTIQDISFDVSVKSIAESHDGQYLAVGLSSDDLILYKLNTDEIKNADGLSLIPLPIKNIIEQYALERIYHKKLNQDQYLRPSSISFSNDDNYLATLSILGISIIDINTGNCIREIRENKDPNHIKFIDNNHLLASYSGGNIKIFDITHGNTIQTINSFDENSEGISIAFNLIYKYIASAANYGANDARIKLWSNPVHFLTIH